MLTRIAATLAAAGALMATGTAAANAAETPAATTAYETLIPQTYVGTFRTHDECVDRGALMYDLGIINEFSCDREGFAGYDLLVTYNY